MLRLKDGTILGDIANYSPKDVYFVAFLMSDLEDPKAPGYSVPQISKEIYNKYNHSLEYVLDRLLGVAI